MPLFSRSDRADRKHKSSGRFSFRKHEPADALASSASSVRSAGSSSSASSSAGRRARDGGGRAKPPPAPAPVPPPAPAKPLSASVASTTGSSVSSSRLSASVRSSTSTARSTSPTIIESLSGDTDTGSDTEARDSTGDDPRMAARGPLQPQSQPLRQSQPHRQSQHGAASPGSARSVRSSLVDYRQLQCSMSYKNRLESQQRSAPGALRASEDRARGSLDDPQFLATTPSSVRSSSRVSEALGDVSDAMDSQPRSSRSSISRLSVALRPSEDAAAPERRSEPRMTEANVAAMQTRRAFQQLTLAAASDDSDLSDDSDDDSDLSDSDSSSSGRFPRRAASSAAAASASASVSAASSASARSGVVKLGADEYRKFQFRLRQLEDLCQEQARKQAFMDEAIEREVELRTRKVVAAMDKKVEMYRQAKALECEREVARRVSEMDARGSSSRGSLSLRRSLLQSSSTMSVTGARPSFSSSLSSIPDSELKGKPLEKIFHPRRARARKVERLREMEEQQKREMEQFRAFIQSTEGGATSLATPLGNGGEPALVASHADVDELLRREPPPTPDELLELVAVLRGHVDVQETQLDEAKRLISAAIDAREAAERMAEEAVALTVQLDSRLDRASREMTWVRDELRRSMSLGPEQFSARASRVLSAPLFFSGAGPEAAAEPAEPTEALDERADEGEDKRARIAAAAGR